MKKKDEEKRLKELNELAEKFNSFISVATNKHIILLRSKYYKDCLEERKGSNFQWDNWEDNKDLFLKILFQDDTPNFTKEDILQKFVEYDYYKNIYSNFKKIFSIKKEQNEIMLENRLSKIIELEIPFKEFKQAPQNSKIFDSNLEEDKEDIIPINVTKYIKFPYEIKEKINKQILQNLEIYLVLFNKEILEIIEKNKNKDENSIINIRAELYGDAKDANPTDVFNLGVTKSIFDLAMGFKNFEELKQFIKEYNSANDKIKESYSGESKIKLIFNIIKSVILSSTNPLQLIKRYFYMRNRLATGPNGEFLLKRAIPFSLLGTTVVIFILKAFISFSSITFTYELISFSYFLFAKMYLLLFIGLFSGFLLIFWLHHTDLKVKADAYAKEALSKLTELANQFN